MPTLHIVGTNKQKPIAFFLSVRIGFLCHTLEAIDWTKKKWAIYSPSSSQLEFPYKTIAWVTIFGSLNARISLDNCGLYCHTLKRLGRWKPGHLNLCERRPTKTLIVLGHIIVPVLVPVGVGRLQRVMLDFTLSGSGIKLNSRKLDMRSVFTIPLNTQFMQ